MMFCCRAARAPRARMTLPPWPAHPARAHRARAHPARVSLGWVRSDRGSNVVELAVLAPGLMMICMLILQFGLWFNARQAALASAQAGALVAREEAAINSGWMGAAQNAAAQYYGNLHTHLLSKVKPHAYGDPATNVYVTVSGPLGYSVFPFFGLSLTISATAGGPVECFRPAARGSCG